MIKAVFAMLGYQRTQRKNPVKLNKERPWFKGLLVAGVGLEPWIFLPGGGLAITEPCLEQACPAPHYCLHFNILSLS